MEFCIPGFIRLKKRQHSA